MINSLQTSQESIDAAIRKKTAADNWLLTLRERVNLGQADYSDFDMIRAVEQCERALLALRRIVLSTKPI